eukprot:gene41145-55635_t
MLTPVLAGCVSAAGLALAVDALLGVIEYGIRHRRRVPVVAAGVTLLVGVALALVPLWPRSGPEITIGAKDFSEQFILSRLIGHRLEREGYRVRYREGLGSAVQFGALTSSAVDISIDYSGTIWTNQMRRTDTPDAATRDVPGMASHHERVVNFVGRQLLDMVAPSNSPLTNPVLQRRIVETGGACLVEGARLLREDLERALRQSPPV